MLCFHCQNQRWPMCGSLLTIPNGKDVTTSRPKPCLTTGDAQAKNDVLPNVELNIKQSIILTPPRPTASVIIPQLTTPAPAPEVIVQVTASKVACTESCDLDHTAGARQKSIECALCQELFHRVCVGVKPTARPMWLCSSCKEIPKTVKILVSTCKTQKEEIAVLKKRVSELTQTPTEQAPIIVKTQIPQQPCEQNHQQATSSGTDEKQQNVRSVSNGATTQTPAQTLSRKEHKTLIIGDSVIKGINEAGLDRTKVTCLRGARVQNIKESLQKASPCDYETIIIHGGTNDCTKDDHVDTATEQYDDMIKYVRDSAPETRLIISTACPRTDNIAHQGRVNTLNLKVKCVAEKYNCGIIDNDDNFKLMNGQADDNLLNRSGLHLSVFGTRKLLANFNDAHAIINKTRYTRRETERHDHVENELNRSPPRANKTKGRKPNTQHTHRNKQDTTTYTIKRGCYFCGEHNHQKKDCKHGKPLKCHACGKLGHKQNNTNLCKK